MVLISISVTYLVMKLLANIEDVSRSKGEK